MPEVQHYFQAIHVDQVNPHQGIDQAGNFVQGRNIEAVQDWQRSDWWNFWFLGWKAGYYWQREMILLGFKMILCMDWFD